MLSWVLSPVLTLVLQASLEVQYHAARLSSHPSVVLWGGNNENEASFTWFQETLANPPLYAVDYSVLFVDTIRQVKPWP